MGKKNDKSKSKAKLKAREAELEAKLKAKAKGKKAKGSVPAKGDAREHPHLDHLDHVGELAKLANNKSAPKADRKAAKAKLAEYADDTHKRAEDAAIGQHAPTEADLEGAADAEHEAREATAAAPADEYPGDAVIKARVAAKRAKRAEGNVNLAAADDAREGELEADYQWRKKDERDAAADAERNAAIAAKPEVVVAEVEVETVAELDELVTRPSKAKGRQVAEVVETENGREFAVGDESVDPFVTVADAPPAVELDRLGRYKIVGPDGKAKALARVTTFIDCLEDKTALDKWKLRTLLEGVTLNEQAVGNGEGNGDRYVSLVADQVHKRDVAIAKARKADRKGKLKVGELGDIIEAATKEFKSALDVIAHDALELGGVHEAANKGTDIHALCDLHDTEGMAAVEAKCIAGECTPADLADVKAYAEAMARLGLKVVESEQVVVNETVGYAGRLDRVLLYKPKGGQRATRVVGDIKTGRVDFGIGKIAMQLSAYANGEGYDPATPDVRRDLKINKRVGLLIHLPQGKAECHVYEVDLTVGVEGNKLASAVRSFRNTGKRAYDLKGGDLAAVDLAVEVATPAAE